MKKVVILVLVVILVMSAFTGCGKTGANDTASTESVKNVETTAASVVETKALEPVNISFWIYPMFKGKNGDGNGEYDDWAKEYGRLFKEKNSNVDVSVELLDWATSTEKVDVSLAAGTPPDLVYTINNFGGVSKYGKLGALEPIDPYLTDADWNDYPDAVKGAMSYGGKAYLWPWLKTVSGMAVNVDLFKERNAMELLPLNKPLRDWTFDEFLKAAQATTFSRSGAKKPDVYGTGIWGKDAIFYIYSFGAANGGRILNDANDQVMINSKEMQDGVQFASDLVSKYKVAPDGAAGMDVNAIQDMFLQQRVAIMPNTTNIITNMKKLPEDQQFNIDFVAPPHGNGTDTKAWNNVGGYIVFKQTVEEKKKQVMDFARFMTDADKSDLLKIIGVFPARNSAPNIYGDDAVMNYFSELSKYGDSNFSRAYGLVATSEWEKEFQALLTNAKPVSDALDSIGKLLGESLNKK